MKESFVSEAGARIEMDVNDRFVTYFNGSVIIRGISEGRDLVVKFSNHNNGAVREWQALNRLNAMGIPTQTPVAFIPGERPGIITEFIDGSPLSSFNAESMRFRLGVIVRDVHSLVEVGGEEWESYGKKDFTFYDKKIEEWKRKKIGGNAIGALEELSSRVGDGFKITSPVFSHNDLHDGQVIVNNMGEFLIDFEVWREAHPMGDLAIYLLNVFRNDTREEYFWEFLNGYNKDSRLLDNQQKEALLFLLLFASCQGLEYFSEKMPKEVEVAQRQHIGAVSFLDREELWRKS